MSLATCDETHRRRRTPGRPESWAWTRHAGPAPVSRGPAR